MKKSPFILLLELLKRGGKSERNMAWFICPICIGFNCSHSLARNLRMLRENLEEEAILMKDVPGWKVKSNKQNKTKKQSGCHFPVCHEQY